MTLALPPQYRFAAMRGLPSEIDTDKHEATVFEDRVEESDAVIEATELGEGIEAYELQHIYFTFCEDSSVIYVLKGKNDPYAKMLNKPKRWKRFWFCECAVCGKTVAPNIAKERNWDFGVDFDAVEPDKDGGVRGHCRKCEDMVPAKEDVE